MYKYKNKLTVKKGMKRYVGKLEESNILLGVEIKGLRVLLDQERRTADKALRKARGPGLGVSALVTTEGEFRVGGGLVWRLF